jgi:hypothetical protein
MDLHGHQGKISVTIVAASVRTEDLQNKFLERYCANQLRLVMHFCLMDEA